MAATTSKGFWRNADAYMVSLLKEYWGDAATPENDYCFDYLPRINGDHGTYRTVMDMVDGKVFGYFLLGQNPAVGSAHGRLQRLGLANLDWLVVRDLAMIESATFWRDAPEIETGEIVPERCRTEVFFMPAASHVEKAGTFTQTQRMLQWRDQAVEPTGDQRSELWFFYHLGRRLKEKLAGSADERDRPLLDLAWDYATEGDEPSGADVLRHINGIDLRTGRTVSGYLDLRADGSTSCGCWIYSGVYADEVNQARRRKPHWEQGAYDPEWGWTWPLDRRVLYNRASADPQGRPWSERKALIWWDAHKGEWTGHDIPDFEKNKPPDYRPPEGAVGPEALHGDDPFIMMSDGKGWLFAPSGLADGPLPTHYEPHESPARNLLYGQQASPVRKVYGRPDNPSNPSLPEAHHEVFPYVFTAARLTEHHTAGGMSRQLPYLSELQPELFVEVSPELAAERGLHHLDWGHVITSRTAVDARVVVTDRMAPLRVDGRTVHQVWMPYHWGYTGLTKGDIVNDLLGVVAEPNVFIQESKVLTCDIRPGRRPRGPALRDYVAVYRRRAGITPETGTQLLTVSDGAGPVHTEPPPAPPGPGPGSSHDTRAQLLRSAGRPRRGRRPPRAPAPGRVLHRHLRLHRLQGVRGGLQGVERGARGRPEPAGHVVRQHRHARRGLLAARRLHRAGTPARGQDAGLAGLPTGPSSTEEAAEVVASALPGRRAAAAISAPPRLTSGFPPSSCPAGTPASTPAPSSAG